jgi:hypothetical protein
MAKLQDILRLVFFNTKIECFNLVDLARIKNVDKECNRLAAEQEIFLKQNYDKWLRARNQRSVYYIEKNKKIKTVSKTYAKKYYKLQDVDIDHIDTIPIYIYRNKCEFFFERELIGVALLKYRQDNHENLKIFLTKPIKKTFLKRNAQLDALYAKMDFGQDVIDNVNRLECITRFMANGSHGIRKIKHNIGEYRDFAKHWDSIQDKNKINIYRNFEYFFKECCERGLEQTKVLIADEILSHDRKNERTRLLMSALNKAGLELRSDSSICAQYIRGDNKKTLDQVVHTMAKMKFLFTCTRYGSVMRNAMRDQRNRWDRRDSDSDDEDEVDVDVEAISEECQDIVVAQYRKMHANNPKMMEKLNLFY